MTRELNELILADLIAARAEEMPDFDVVTFESGDLRPDEVRTYADLWMNGNRIAAGLMDRGLGKGDRFALMMRNHPEFVETMVAASLTGGVFVPIDPRTKGEKLAYTLRNSECRGIVCADYALAEVAAVREGLPDLEWIIVLETQEEPGSMSTSLVKGAEPFAPLVETPEVYVTPRVDVPGDPLEIVYTSGTTGDPKGVVCANARYVGASMMGYLCGLQVGDRPYNGLSLTHGNAQMVTLASSLVIRMRAVFSRRFTKSRLWDVCRQHGCTSFSLVGGMATAIYSEPPRPDDAHNPVRLVVSGGMPPAIWEPFETRFEVKILEFYGAMDGGGMAYKPVGEGPVGSFGRPMPGIEMKVLDAEGHECPPGVVGEICVRPIGGEASVEYFGNPEASKRKIQKGWNRSGDMGHADADGWLFFDYRAGGGIRHNGDFIDPSYVEKTIAEHPDVADVFVFGVPSANGAPGEKDVVAAIVPVDPAHLNPAAIFAACRARLEPNFVPSYLQLVDEIPKTASEKPQERFLIDGFDPRAANVHVEGAN